MFSTAMNNKRALEVNKRVNFHASSAKSNLTKCLVEAWRNLEAEQRWKYDELSPVQLLKKLKLDRYPLNQDELARAEFFWSRRPRLLTATGYVAWLIVALGLPFWVFMVPAIGVPLLVLSAVVVDTGIIRSVRWRRQYELSIDRLIRHFGRREQPTSSV
jgi:hypothetical protein